MYVPDTVKREAQERRQAEREMGPDDRPPIIGDAGARETIADEAKRIVTGARRGTYGNPERNFERIALFWTAYFKAKGVDIVITAADVSPMMRLMKEARLVENPTHRDSFVDIIGYALTGAEINGVDSSS